MTVGSSIQGLAIRVKRLDLNGNPTGDTVVSDGFVRVQSSVRSQAGTETTVRNAAGAICVQKKAPDLTTGTDITIDFCQVNPQLFDIVSTINPVENASGDIAGFQQGTRPKSGYFSLEIWSEAVGGTMGAFFYSLFPKVAVGMVGGSVTWEDGPQTWTLTAPAEPNPNWGVGTDAVAHDVGVTAIIDPDDAGARTISTPVHVDSFFYTVTTNVTPPVAESVYDQSALDNMSSMVFVDSGGDPVAAPADLAALKANAVFGDTGTGYPYNGGTNTAAAWPPDDYVILGDASQATWNGTVWVVFGA